MGLLHGLNNVKSLVQYGNRADICVLCLRNMAVEKKMDQVTARNRLKGQMEGKHVVKLRQSGADVVICLEHIHSIAKQFPLAKGAEPVEEE